MKCSCGKPISNLARNALEACAGASVAPDIRLEASRDDRGRVVHVRVSDNGPGIDPALRERVFRPFFTTKRDGTGLGLALVLKIVVTHNGRVRVVDRRQGRDHDGRHAAASPSRLASRFVTKSSSLAHGLGRARCRPRLRYAAYLSANTPFMPAL